MPEVSASFPTVRIEPEGASFPIHLRELWEYRELLYFLTWRDIKVRYKQTLLGAGWAILQPLLNTLLITFIFGRLAKMASNGIPYPLFAFTALLPWQFFSFALTQASTSLVVNERVITKIYFPRVLVPLSAVLGGMMDFFVAFLLLIILLFLYHILPTGLLLLLPLFLGLALATALGVGLWLCALDAQYRDVRYTIPFLTQFWFFATPIIYPSSLLSEPWQTLSGLNPMSGVVEGFRWILVGGPPVPFPLMLTSILSAAALLLSGLLIFHRMESRFADTL